MSTSLEQWMAAIPSQRWRGDASVPANAGLWLDRCLIEPESHRKDAETTATDRPGRRLLFQKAVESMRVGDPTSPGLSAYRVAYERWRTVVDGPQVGVVRRVVEARARSRILLHPAAQETVTESSVLLHHTYGVPYLPGSALKGAARARAKALMEAGSEPTNWAPRRKGHAAPNWVDDLFGFEAKPDGSGAASLALSESLTSDSDSQDSGVRDDWAGLVDFHDALLIPIPPPGAMADFSALATDVVTPHQSDYYTKKLARPAPNEMGEPIPTSLLTVSPGTTFLVVLEVRDVGGRVLELWMDWVLRELLGPALRDHGVGARTSSGYGRLELLGVDLATSTSPAEAKAPKAPEPSTSEATIVWIPGQTLLRATLRVGSPVAELRGEPAKRILETLPPELLARLRKGKEIRANVSWEAEGRARRIVGISG